MNLQPSGSTDGQTGALSGGGGIRSCPHSSLCSPTRKEACNKGRTSRGAAYPVNELPDEARGDYVVTVAGHVLHLVVGQHNVAPAGQAVGVAHVLLAVDEEAAAQRRAHRRGGGGRGRMKLLLPHFTIIAIVMITTIALGVHEIPGSLLKFYGLEVEADHQRTGKSRQPASSRVKWLADAPNHLPLVYTPQAYRQQRSST